MLKCKMKLDYKKKNLVPKILFCGYFLVFSLLTNAQGPFPPAADSLGTTAISKDSSCIASWAMDCQIGRGYQNILNASGPYATVGDQTSAIGKADGIVVSLGDGGTATFTLSTPLANLPGFDFAVFENGFYDPIQQGYFLELAFVDVSSNGIDYFRFPNKSLTPTDVQTGTFGTTDPTQINGLAGKYKAGYGTPFDLQELDTVAGLDINSITHIRIIDVVGIVHSSHSTFDSDSIMINDPFPTDFSSGGFDLDAIAFLDFSLVSSVNSISESKFQVYPNPTSDILFWNHANEEGTVSVFDISGNKMVEAPWNRGQLDLSNWPQGFYFFTATTSKGNYIRKIGKI